MSYNQRNIRNTKQKMIMDDYYTASSNLAELMRNLLLSIKSSIEADLAMNEEKREQKGSENDGDEGLNAFDLTNRSNSSH